LNDQSRIELTAEGYAIASPTWLPQEAGGEFHVMSGEHRRGGETILLVEDEAFVREVACEVLRSAGYTVLSAKNGTEAGGAYKSSRAKVELLLTDVILPGENGKVLAGRLKRENSGLKVLFITGYAEQMGWCEAEQKECLAKPFSTGALLQRVRQALDRRSPGWEGIVKADEESIRRAGGNE
jgi:hypothetical protein